MKIKTVEFARSAFNEEQYPKDNLPQIVIVGRSNVGKSTLINTVLNRKNLAKTSSRPGKTRGINFYLINN
ncbi:MAG TPA: YihA family ribosome biogenesis GTP-binding protein, partial [Thermoanaerobacter sp.]|nr:YihA family ribosome biogenesis GTP-binding protein [Thermoanaerobacter sp.]